MVSFCRCLCQLPDFGCVVLALGKGLINWLYSYCQGYEEVLFVNGCVGVVLDVGLPGEVSGWQDYGLCFQRCSGESYLPILLVNLLYP